MVLLFSGVPRVGVTGVTSATAINQIKAMEAAGTNICWFVGAASQDDVRRRYERFGSIDNALAATIPDCLLMFDDPLDVLKVASRAVSQGVRKIVITSENVPVHDVINLRNAAHQVGALAIGPSSTGLYVPSIVKAGFFSDDICIQGNVGVLAKSGSLAYAVLTEMRNRGLGASGIISTGGELIKGACFDDLIPHFERDPQTHAIVLLGEVGGTDEERSAKVIRNVVSKPVVAFISGKSIKAGTVVGHAGAIIRNGIGDYRSKLESLRSVGVRVARQFGEIVPLLVEALGETDSAVANL